MNRRKELKWEYKNTWKPIGIYCLRNKINGKMLIDASENLTQIKNRIYFELKTGASYHKSLLKDWQEMGEEAFVFEILEEVKEKKDDPSFDYQSTLSDLLEHYLDKFEPFGDNGYNHARVRKL